MDVIFPLLGLFAQSEKVCYPSLMIKLKIKFLDDHLFFTFVTFVTLVIANNNLLSFMCLLEFLRPNLSSYEIIR